MTCELAILCALEIEAEPIKIALDMEEIHDHFDPRSGLKLYKSNMRHVIKLVQFGTCSKSNVNRIGTQMACLAAWETIKTLNPKIIASVGTAGGFQRKGACIGDVYYSNKIYFHGRHIPVEAYKSYEIGDFTAVNLPNLRDVKFGVVSSSDSVSASIDDLNKMHELGTDAKEMEAAAIAEIAAMTDTPMFALKSISDFIDSPVGTHTQFVANVKLATAALTKSLRTLIHENYVG